MIGQRGNSLRSFCPESGNTVQSVAAYQTERLAFIIPKPASETFLCLQVFTPFFIGNLVFRLGVAKVFPHTYTHTTYTPPTHLHIPRWDWTACLQACVCVFGGGGEGGLWYGHVTIMSLNG